MSLRPLSPAHKQLRGQTRIFRPSTKSNITDEEVVRIMYVYKNGKTKVHSLDTDEVFVCLTKRLYQLATAS